MRGIWKHPKTQNWIARYRGANGKWVNRSTGTADEEEAERTSAGWRLEAERQRAKQASEISPSGISDTVARAERLARSGRLDQHAARSIINSLVVAAGHQQLDAVSNRKWCEDWQASKAGAVKERSKSKYGQVTRDWLEHLGNAADRPLEAVSRGDAIAFRDGLTKAGLVARSVNQTVKLLRGIYQAAVEEGHIGRNPFTGVASLRETDEETQRVPFTKADVEALLKHAEGDWKGLVLLAATTGLRLMDGARLQWRAVNLDTGIISVKPTKTEKARKKKLTLPMHAEFTAWLLQQPRGIGMAPIFPSLATKAGPGKSGLSMAFKRLMEAAGVKSGVARQAKKKSRGRTTSQKSFHSLRHFATTQLAEAGVRDDVARAITGHADPETHAGYVSPEIDAMRDAVNAIRLSA
jgi:integrase